MKAGREVERLQEALRVVVGLSRPAGYEFGDTDTLMVAEAALAGKTVSLTAAGKIVIDDTSALGERVHCTACGKLSWPELWGDGTCPTCGCSKDESVVHLAHPQEVGGAPICWPDAPSAAQNISDVTCENCRKIFRQWQNEGWI